MFRKTALLLLLTTVFLAPSLRADEPIRQAQEELRKRNLFYGDIDGRHTPALAAALRQYQERKGFPPTGQADPDTLRSMGISEDGSVEQLPNVPILRSDRGLAEGSNPAAGSLPFFSGQAAANAPPPSREELRTFIANYLAACETPSVTDELNYYGARVEYFDHGIVNKTYIRNELVAYGQQWPERKYTPGKSLTISRRGDQTVARCRISFTLASPEQNRRASAETANTFVLSRRADLSWEIVGHREERVRRSARRRSRRDPVSATMRRMQRSVRKLFR